MKRLALLAVSVLMLSGCASVISEQSRKLVDPNIQFGQLREKPDAYVGKYVMVGGRIVTVKNTKEGGVLEVVQFHLDSSGMPQATDQTGGRFLATSTDFLDNAVFKPGRLITLVGEVKGKKTMPLDQIEYTYPVIAMREYYLWTETDYDRDYFYPPLPYYDPYYFGYGAPYWMRPYEPVPPRWR